MATPESANTAAHMDAQPKSPRIMTKPYTASANTTFCRAICLV